MIAHKTKAAMPGRQCNTALLKRHQITRLAGGGQTLSSPVLARSNYHRGFKIRAGVQNLSSPDWGCSNPFETAACNYPGRILRVSNPDAQNQSRNSCLAHHDCNSLKMSQTTNLSAAQNLNYIGADHRMGGYESFVGEESTYTKSAGHSTSGNMPVFRQCARYWMAALISNPIQYGDEARTTSSVTPIASLYFISGIPTGEAVNICKLPLQIAPAFRNSGCKKKGSSPLKVSNGREPDISGASTITKNSDSYSPGVCLFEFDVVTAERASDYVICLGLIVSHMLTLQLNKENRHRNGYIVRYNQKKYSNQSFGSFSPRPNIFLQTAVNWSFRSLLHVAGGADMNLKARNATATMIIRIIHLRIIYPFDVQCLEKNRNIQKATVITTIKTDCHGLIISRSPLESGYQPFVSMPRCVSSLRMMRFIQAAKDSSPSSCCAFSIIALSSGSKRNWNGGLPRLSLLCVDTLITPDVMCLCVMTHYTHNVKKATPRSAGTLPRRLTKPLVGVTIMAESQSTQTRPKFTWRFLAVDKSTPGMRPITLYTNAPTEEEARENCPGWILYFAARLPLFTPEIKGAKHA